MKASNIAVHAQMHTHTCRHTSDKNVISTIRSNHFDRDDNNKSNTEEAVPQNHTKQLVTQNSKQSTPPANFTSNSSLELDNVGRRGVTHTSENTFTTFQLFHLKQWAFLLQLHLQFTYLVRHLNTKHIIITKKHLDRQILPKFLSSPSLAAGCQMSQETVTKLHTYFSESLWRTRATTR